MTDEEPKFSAVNWDPRKRAFRRVLIRQAPRGALRRRTAKCADAILILNESNDVTPFQGIIAAVAAIVLFLQALQGFSREVQAVGGASAEIMGFPG